MNHDIDRLCTIFKVLSEPNRMRILDFLTCEELCGCELLEKLDITHSTLSHHMKMLHRCGLVRIRKEGKWSYYSIDKGGLKEFREAFERIIQRKACMRS